MIDSESFVDEWFWQKVKFVSLWQQQAWRTALCECDLKTFKIDQHTHDCTECRQYIENAKTSSYKEWCSKNNTDRQKKQNHCKDESSWQNDCIVRSDQRKKSSAWWQ